MRHRHTIIAARASIAAKASLTMGGILLAALPMACDEARAADPVTRPIFAPTAPDGVASDLPRSPLADLIVNGTQRFARALDAQMRCPTDVVVWVGAGSNFYRRAGAERSDAIGAYMCQGDASAEGDRPGF